jgi:hypothetical protein
MGEGDDGRVHALELRLHALESRIKYGLWAILFVAAALGLTTVKTIYELLAGIGRRIREVLEGDVGEQLAALRAGAEADAGAIRGALAELCADPDAVERHGFCIFHLNPGHYTLDHGAAEALCAANGARLCRLDELAQAQPAGAQWCSWGWVSARSARDSGSADRDGIQTCPMQSTDRPGCGAALLMERRKPKTGPDSDAGANCCI